MIKRLAASAVLALALAGCGSAAAAHTSPPQSPAPRVTCTQNPNDSSLAAPVCQPAAPQAPAPPPPWTVACTVGYLDTVNDTFTPAPGPVEPYYSGSDYIEPSVQLTFTNNTSVWMVSPGWTVTTDTGSESPDSDWGAGVVVGPGQTSQNIPAGSAGGNTSWVDGASSCSIVVLV
jgi:hypothetical protein